MEEAHSSIPHLREVVVFLIAAGIVLPVMHRLRINPVLGYLVTGAVIGPFGLGLLVDDLPWLGYAVIADIDGVKALAELGVIFLLFMIGLELSFDRLWRMRRLVFGLGGAQVVITGIAIGAIAFAWGNSASTSIVLGACLALSSTAIVMQLLIDRRQVGAPVGRASFSILLFQDLAVVPILFLLGVLGFGAEHAKPHHPDPHLGCRRLTKFFPAPRALEVEIIQLPAMMEQHLQHHPLGHPLGQVVADDPGDRHVRQVVDEDDALDAGAQRKDRPEIRHRAKGLRRRLPGHQVADPLRVGQVRPDMDGALRRQRATCCT